MFWSPQRIIRDRNMGQWRQCRRAEAYCTNRILTRAHVRPSVHHKEPQGNVGVILKRICTGAGGHDTQRGAWAASHHTEGGMVAGSHNTQRGTGAGGYHTQRRNRNFSKYVNFFFAEGDPLTLWLICHEALYSRQLYWCSVMINVD